MVVATRNAVVESTVDENIRLWVTAHVDAALERVKVDMRNIVTEALTSHVSRNGGSTRTNGEGLQSEPNKKKRLLLEVFLSVSAVVIILSIILALYIWIKWKRSNVNSDGSEAKLLVVVFSKNYANSSCCLEELGKIMECRDVTGQRVLSVLYDVEPSDVRGQKSSFLEALNNMR
ncbi:TMV resistance protein N [Artemisia annua]|uniref:TMV resistance protein N n=1 Tax=Artemisia annua TaxID=35608 RepID=A0A2U1MHA5_ARTAN|nr:TMV resistance protein N [Artemisia annua]